MDIYTQLKENEEREKFSRNFPESLDSVAMWEEGEKYLAERARWVREAAPPPNNEQKFLAWMANDLLDGAPASLDEIFNPPAQIEYTFEEVRQAIINRLGVDTFKANGFSKKYIPCVFHDDKHASASLHREIGLQCFTCGQTFTWKQLAERLGIPWTVNKIEPAIIGDFIGMSRAERRAFIRAGLTNLARVLDVCIDRERGGELLTLREMTDVLGDVLSPRCVWDAFNQLRGKRLPNKREGEYLTDFFLSYSQLKDSKKSVKYSKRGQPAATARIPMPQEIQAAVKVVPDVHYGMTRQQMAKAAEYRAACMVDEIRRKPGKYARKQLAAPLGISYPTIKAHCQRGGIVITPQPPKLTELTPAEVAALPTDRKALRLMILQKKVRLNVSLSNEYHMITEYTQEGARRLMEAGGSKINKIEWQASDYQIKEENHVNS